MIRLSFRTALKAPPHEVWARVSTMDGVNQELHPWVHMTVPAAFRRRSLQDATPAQLQGVLFRSVLLAFCCIPFDLHALRLARVLPGEGFNENSTSWMQKTWMHRRRVLADGDGCVVVDELAVEPRLFFMAPVVRLIVGFLFRHRHRRLAEIFGRRMISA
jgi:ligand-binding SRPBCC domain-containing protein